MTDQERVEEIRSRWEAPPRTWESVTRRLETAEADILFLCGVVQQAGMAVTVLKQQLEEAKAAARRYRRALRDEDLPELGDGN